jgi:hypothetical protein
MNLQSWMNNHIADAGNRVAVTLGIFRQFRQHGLLYPRRPMKSLPGQAINLTVCACWALAFAFVSAVSAQTNYYSPNGAEYAVVGSLPGDQMFPDAAISTTNGFVVWQDNATDGDGWGISASRINSLNWQRQKVNVQGAGNQENPRVAMLKNGGAVFVWQGGRQGFQHVYARLVTPAGLFVPSGSDLLVSTPTNNFQINPAVAVLNNSNILVVWSSYNQAASDSMQDVYGQILSPDGQKIGGEFRVNQFTDYNQRTPAIAASPAGGFVVVWVSEQQQKAAAVTGTTNTAAELITSTTPSVDIYAQQFNAAGIALGNEFLVNAGNNPCANPSVAAAADGTFLVAWTARDMANLDNSLDVVGRVFAANGVGGSVFYLNAWLYGDQYAPRVNSIGSDYLVTWTSLAQDGAREGVYARFVHSDGSLVGGELRVNTTTAGSQMQPAVAADGVSRFLVVWTSYASNYDLYAQKYLNSAAVLQPLVPFVWAPFVVSNGVYQPSLVVSWEAPKGLSVAHYDVYVNGATNSATAVVTTNQWTMSKANGLTTKSTNSFQVDYVLTDGRRSPISDSATGNTWGGSSWGGIPYEWMEVYYNSLNFVFGPNGVTYNWPDPNVRLAPSGLTLMQVFLSGGNPLDSSTWLHTQLTPTSQGMFLSWNAQPGATYQVQVTTNFTSWVNFGAPQFAAQPVEQMNVGVGAVGYYRVVLLRQ